MERLKIMPKSEVKGISVIYVNPTLTFEQIITSINKYVKETYLLNNGENFDKALALKMGNAVSNLKRFFDDFYIKGIDLYSFIHGKIEVELLSYALRPYEIKFTPIDVGGHILTFLTLDQLGKVSVNSKYDMDLLMEEINKYLNKYEVIEDKIVKKRRF